MSEERTPYTTGPAAGQAILCSDCGGMGSVLHYKHNTPITCSACRGTGLKPPPADTEAGTGPGEGGHAWESVGVSLRRCRHCGTHTNDTDTTALCPQHPAVSLVLTDELEALRQKAKHALAPVAGSLTPDEAERLQQGVDAYRALQEEVEALRQDRALLDKMQDVARQNGNEEDIRQSIRQALDEEVARLDRVDAAMQQDKPGEAGQDGS